MSVSAVLDSCGNRAILMFQKSFRNKSCFETRVLFRNPGEGGGGVKSVIPASAVTCPTRQCMMSICSRF